MATEVETSGDIMTTPELVALIVELRMTRRIYACFISEVSASRAKKFRHHTIAESFKELKIYAAEQRFRVHYHRVRRPDLVGWSTGTIDIEPLGQS